MSTQNADAERQDRSGHGPGRGRGVPARRRCPRSTRRCGSRTPAIDDARGQPRARGRAAPRREHRPLHRDGHDRRPRARPGGPRTPATRSAMPVGPETLGRIINVIGEPVDERGPIKRQDARCPIHRAAARVRRPVDRRRGVRDRHQGRRPARALSEGRQDRPVRRRRRRQDRPDPGADQQHREAARRLLGVRRRRRAHARGQRPLARDDGGEALRRHHRARQDRAGLRPDERAARRARARRALGAHRRRVLPRRGGQGRAALHRQHLPLHAGGLGGVGAARPHPVRGRLPADALAPTWASCRSASPRPRRARSPRCRRSTCPPTTSPTRRRRPRSRTSTRRPCSRARSPSSASTRPSIRSTRRAASSTRRSSARSTTRSRAACSRCSRSTRTSRTSSRSSAWTSSPRTTRSRWRARASSSVPVAAVPRRRAVHRHARRVRAARGHDPRLQGDPRGQARRAPRAGLLHGRHDRGRGRQGEEAGASARCRSTSPS